MAYEIYALSPLHFNQSMVRYSVGDIYDQAYGYDYNLSFVPSQLSVVPQVHISAKILVGITYCLLMSICGIGNLLLCYVIYRFRRMRSTTNLLIGNLALSDFLVAVICAPFNFYFYIFQTWPFGGVVCVAVGYLKTTSLYVSTNSLLAIAIDRYVVITYPLKPRMTRGTTAILLTFIWLVSTSVTIPVAMHIGVFTLQLKDGTESVQCAENWKNSYAIKTYTLLIATAQFLFPLLAMCVAYYFIAKTLWFREIPGGHNTEEQEQAAESSKRRTIRMLILVVALFALCWAPYHGLAITRDVIIPYDSVPENYSLYHTLYYVVEALAMSNSVFNTMIYIVFNANFRKCAMQLKFPIVFHYKMRNTSVKIRTSRPTSNFRMMTYQRSTGPENKSFCYKNWHRSLVSKFQSQDAQCCSTDSPEVRKSSQCFSQTTRLKGPLKESEFTSEIRDNSRLPLEQEFFSHMPVVQIHHAVAQGRETIVSVVNVESGVGSKV